MACSNITLESGIQDTVDCNSTMKLEGEFFTLCDGKNISVPKNLTLSLATPIAMATTGVLGNILALVVLYTSKKEIQRTVFYTFLSGLAWTDLIGQLMTAPIAIIVYANDMQWLGGAPLCSYHGFAMVLFGILTPVLVLEMSLERVLALKCAYFHARCVTRRKAQMVIILTWILMLMYSSLPLMGFGSYERQFPGSWCFLNFNRQSTLDIAYAYTFSLCNIGLIVAIICCNSTVVVTLLQMRKNRQYHRSPSAEKRFQIKPKPFRVEQETMMVVFLCAVTIVFSTCWLPLNINILKNQITCYTDKKTDLITIRMAGTNQILDPWLYIFLRKSMFIKVFGFFKRLFSRNNSELSRSMKNRQANIVQNGSSQLKTPNENCHFKLVDECADSESEDSYGSGVQMIPRTTKGEGNVNDPCSMPLTPSDKDGEADKVESDSDSDVFLESSTVGQYSEFKSVDDSRLQVARRRGSVENMRHSFRKLKRMLSSPPDFAGNH